MKAKHDRGRNRNRACVYSFLGFNLSYGWRMNNWEYLVFCLFTKNKHLFFSFVFVWKVNAPWMFPTAFRLIKTPYWKPHLFLQSSFIWLDLKSEQKWTLLDCNYCSIYFIKQCVMHIDLIMKICGIVWIGSGKLGDLFIEFFYNWSWQVWLELF